MPKKYTPEDIEALLHRAEQKLPVMQEEKYRQWFIDALKQSEKNYQPDNPFDKLVGSYEVDVDLDKDIIEKVAYIQDKILDWLEARYPDKTIILKPTDRTGAYIVEEGSKLRRVRLARLLKDAPPEVQKLMTQFPVRRQEQRTRIVISNNPIDLLMKSSGRAWVEQSCERLGGQYEKGAFSDIANNNAIAYVHFGNNPEPSARIMLRWCKRADGKSDVGVEPVMYPRGQAYQFAIYDALSNILAQKGYGDYDVCITPYVYEGYSDEMGMGHTKIKYHTPGADSLVTYASDPDISRNVALTLLDAGENVRSQLAENPGVCKHDIVVERILDREDNGNVLTNLLMTCEPELNCEQAKRLSKHEDRLLRIQMGDYKKVPKECECEILTRLAGDNQWTVSHTVAHRQSLPRECECEILTKLANYDHPVVRFATANRTDLPEECACDILKTLSRDYNIGTREKIAEKRNIPKECACEIFNKLKNDNYVEVRMNVVNNPSLPPECACEILDTLKDDRQSEIREIVAQIPNIPEACACGIFNKLAGDRDSSVRGYVASNIHIPEACACDIYKKLADDTSPHVRFSVAQNPHLPKECACEILSKLAEDEVDVVRRGVATNPHPPKECACEILSKLAEDEDDEVRRGVAISPHHLPKECACEIFNKLKNDYDTLVRAYLAESTDIPEECACDIFSSLAQDVESRVRTAVALNKHIPPKCACEIFNKLKDDKHHHVRQALAENDAIPEECACEIFNKLLQSEETRVSVKVELNKLYQRLCR